MKIFKEQKDLALEIKRVKFKMKSIGFVPTMGALHDGHLALVRNSIANNDVTVVSIFVNPTQFDNKEDLKKYPRNLDLDAEILKTVSDDLIVYAPTPEDVYQNNVIASTFDFDGLEHEMEGKFRKGHFDGVGTIVKRLFEIVQPDNAYFGEKDYQQLQIIKKLTEKHKIPVNIVGCSIHREKDGLAMSSRNQRLKQEYRQAAPFIYKTLVAAKNKFGTESANKVTNWVEQEFKAHDLLDLEYFVIADEQTLKPAKRKSKQNKYRAFIAVYARDIRLIDNIALN